ncbi:MAG TPA: hypothetical protein VLA74_01685 [Nitrososphaeraceae archaeon]|nr:hypothetical protein [Nitrososphaeraceae archaeon]
MGSFDIDWNDVIKKEARGINDEDLGEVKEVKSNYVLVQRGIIDKEKFYIPKDQAESYDGNVLKFRLSESYLSKYQNEPSFQEDEMHINKIEEEITVQDADFKNKAQAVKNKEVTDNESHNADYNSEDIIKKEARGLGDDTDFGEVQEILGEYIITQKGNVAKDRFYIPKNLVERFDGETVYFKITKDEAKQYKRD